VIDGAGTLIVDSAASPALGEPIRFTAYVPGGAGDARLPALYLLHGRGGSMEDWAPVVAEVAPSAIVVMPDAPWSDRSGWYVDSRHVAGRPVETALTRDLVAHVDAHYPTIAAREARAVGGYSMGGAGALRLALAHQRLFSAALVLSPAVYALLPPASSNARAYGAFGEGSTLFVDDVYRDLDYRALLPDVELPLRLFLAVGDEERPAAAETRALYEAARAVPSIDASLHELRGGHDWGTWRPAFERGLRELYG
jgi:S-formylglutathione hydrolase FrmB